MDGDLCCDYSLSGQHVRPNYYHHRLCESSLSSYGTIACFENADDRLGRGGFQGHPLGGDRVVRERERAAARRERAGDLGADGGDAGASVEAQTRSAHGHREATLYTARVKNHLMLPYSFVRYSLNW